MKIASLNFQQVAQCLGSDEGLTFDVGPFTVRLLCRIRAFTDYFYHFYSKFPLRDSKAIADFHLSLRQPWGVRRKVIFYVDDHSPFQPFPVALTIPLFEWGLNWCIATRAQQFMMLHAGVVEKNDHAIIFPAFPGSGKSTLCAALAHRGWRFLSDEFGLIDPNDANLVPIPKPTPLKNESIEIIRNFAPQAVLGPLFPKTRKGTVAHCRASNSSIEQMKKKVRARWIMFPRYQYQAPVSMAVLPDSYSCLKLATNAFNYELLGAQGFETIAKLVQQCDCHQLNYGRLDEVIEHLDAMETSIGES